MFCTKCGKEINANATVCPDCGVQVNKFNGSVSQRVENVIAIVGFALSFFFSIAGMYCATVGYERSIKEDAPSKEFAIAGMITGAACLVIKAVIFILIEALK